MPSRRPDLLLAGPAPKVGEQGRIVVSSDGGDSWQAAGDGVDQPMPDMVELFVEAPDGTLRAICSAGRLLSAEPGEWRWQSAIPGVENQGVEAVTFVPA